MEYASADATALARAHSRTSTRTDASPTSRANATTEPGAVGRRSRHRHGIADVGHSARQVNLGRNHDCRLSGQLWILIAYHNHRRHDLLHGELGKLAFRSLQNVAIAATTTATGGRLRRR